MKNYSEEMPENKLIIVRGLPGSGKSTKAKEIVGKTQYSVHAEADMFHLVRGEYLFDINKIGDAHNWCQSSVVYWLNRGYTVVVSNTFTTIEEMEPYFEMADKYGAYIEVVEMKESFGSIHDVPEDVLTKMADRWEDYK